jgi:hypothetical protein
VHEILLMVVEMDTNALDYLLSERALAERAYSITAALTLAKCNLTESTNCSVLGCDLLVK